MEVQRFPLSKDLRVTAAEKSNSSILIPNIQALGVVCVCCCLICYVFLHAAAFSTFLLSCFKITETVINRLANVSWCAGSAVFSQHGEADGNVYDSRELPILRNRILGVQGNNEAEEILQEEGEGRPPHASSFPRNPLPDHSRGTQCRIRAGHKSGWPPMA